MKNCYSHFDLNSIRRRADTTEQRAPSKFKQVSQVSFLNTNDRTLFKSHRANFGHHHRWPHTRISQSIARANIIIKVMRILFKWVCVCLCFSTESVCRLSLTAGATAERQKYVVPLRWLELRECTVDHICRFYLKFVLHNHGLSR